MPRARVAVATVLCAAAIVAGCGSDDEQSIDADPSTATSTTTTAPPAADSTTTTGAPDDPGDPSTTTTVDGEGISELEVLAADLLVLGPELGVAAQDLGWAPPGPSTCGFDLDAEHAVDVVAGTTLLTDNGTFEQVLRVYPDTESAAEAYDAAVDHEAECNFESGAATGPTDVSGEVGADAAASFSQSTRSGNLVRITTHVADAVVTFSLSGQVGFVLDPIEVAAFGIGKILAALEA